jgi:hypothetical protein
MATQTDHTYRADVTREDGWWMIYVPELDALTQAHSWAEVEPMATGLISAILDVDPSTIRIDLIAKPDELTQQLLAEAREKTAEADRLRREAVAANQAAAQRLHSNGWSYRLIAKAMHLTHQRVQQLVNSPTRARTR